MYNYLTIKISLNQVNLLHLKTYRGWKKTKFFYKEDPITLSKLLQFN
jgi:hypothetical protein